MKFVKKIGAIQPWELCDKFGITEEAARNKLSICKNEGLVINVPGKLPAWERELKHNPESRPRSGLESLPRRERGLKHNLQLPFKW